MDSNVGPITLIEILTCWTGHDLDPDHNLYNGQGKCKYANRKHTCDFISDPYSNVDPICYHFRNIQSICAWPWPWPLEWAKVKCKYVNRKAYATSHVLAIAWFVLTVTVFEIITFELPNVIDSNLWPWKWKSQGRWRFNKNYLRGLIYMNSQK